MMEKAVLNVLACTEDKADLREKKDKLVCTKCGREYAVKEGIPVFMPISS